MVTRSTATAAAATPPPMATQNQVFWVSDLSSSRAALPWLSNTGGGVLGGGAGGGAGGGVSVGAEVRAGGGGVTFVAGGAALLGSGLGAL